MSTMAIASQPIALELHSLLRDLDPARFKREKAHAIRLKVDGLKERISGLVEGSIVDRSDAIRPQLRSVSTILGETPSAEANVDRWAALRKRLHPAYEALAVRLREHEVDVPSLRPTNYARSFFHVCSALIALLIIELTPQFMLIGAIAFAVSGWTMEITRRYSDRANELIMKAFGPVAHAHERHQINSATWYASALVVLALTGKPVLGALAVTILGLGDPAAAIIGRRFGRTKLVNNRSLEGSTAFFVVGTLAAMAVLAIFHPEYGVLAALALGSVAAFFAAVGELFSRRVDDNLSVPLMAAAGALLCALLLGLPLL